MMRARVHTGLAVSALLGAGAAAAQPTPPAPGSNPIVRDKFTADPAPLVVANRLYLYVGHDEAQRH